MSKIIRLAVQNLLRIKAAEVHPDGSLVIVAGRNDAGKSSLLNSIAIALSGKDVPTQPIRSGAAQGQVVLEIDEPRLVVTRKFSQTGGSSLEVRDGDGAKVTSPQSKLDALLNRITFDPFEFTRLEPMKQVETLRRIVGLDFTALDRTHKQEYDERTVVNRAARDKEAFLKTLPRHADVPREEQSAADLADELAKATETNKQNEELREELSSFNDGVDDAESAVRLAEENLVKAQRALESAKSGLETVIKERDALKAKTQNLQDVDTDAILAKMREIDAINAKVRDNKRWTEESGALIQLQGRANSITGRLEDIQQQKAKALAEAKFPVEGLGFNDQGVTYNGLPFDQAGTAVKIRVSLAIARSLNPQLPVMLIRDGSLLDADSLKLVSEEAEKNGLQVWMEVVGDREDATVVIEDGQSIEPAKRQSKPVPEPAAAEAP